MKGRFITIEGQDGAGKSTNIKFIKNYLEARKIKVHTTREPGGTPLGEELRESLLYKKDFKFADITELLLMFAVRAQHLNDVIKPKLNLGIWVVSDRFTDATYAYQGAGRGIPMSEIHVIEQLVQKGFKPDLTVLLDISLETAKSRGATNDSDRFEQQQDQFKQRVRDYYLSLCESDSHRVKRVDASQPLCQVRDEISNHLDQLIINSPSVQADRS